MGAAAIPLALTGLAAGTAGAATYVQAQGVAAADRFKSEQSQIAADTGRTAAAQTDSALRDELHTTLSNIEAIRASTGTTPYSPTGNAIAEKSIDESDRQRRIRVQNIMNQVGLDEQGAGFYRSAAKNALFQGALGAAASGFKVLTAGTPRTVRV